MNNLLAEKGHPTNIKKDEIFARVDEVVEEEKRTMNKDNFKRNDTFMKELKKIDYEGYKVLKTQEQKIVVVQKAEDNYKEVYNARKRYSRKRFDSKS